MRPQLYCPTQWVLENTILIFTIVTNYSNLFHNLFEELLGGDRIIPEELLP